MFRFMSLLVQPCPSVVLQASSCLHPDEGRAINLLMGKLPGYVNIMKSLARRHDASQRSLHNAPIFRLLLKVAVNGTHQCDSSNFCGASSPNTECDMVVAVVVVVVVCGLRGAPIHCNGWAQTARSLAMCKFRSRLAPAMGHRPPW